MTQAGTRKSAKIPGAEMSAQHRLHVTRGNGKRRYDYKKRTFDPGAAHISRTIWCGSTPRKSGGSMETASCRVIFPCQMEPPRLPW